MSWSHPHQIPGLGHQVCNLLCLIEEAKILQRCVILPELILSPLHNHGRQGKSRFGKYYSFDRIEEEIPICTYEEAERFQFHSRKNIQPTTSTRELEDCETQLMVRKFPDWNAFEIESRLPYSIGEKDGTSRRWMNTFAYPLLKPSILVNRLTEKLIEDLGEYFAIHVRRGDRVKDPVWDQATQPNVISKRIRDWIPDGSRVVVMSDEQDQSFFDPLNENYTVILARELFESKNILTDEPDNFLLFSVESEVFRRAKLPVTTEYFKGPVLTEFSLLDPPNSGQDDERERR